VDRAAVKRQLVGAAVITRDFAREFIEERLPDEMRFRVHLNSSHDANAGPEFKRFPKDSSEERTLATKELDLDAVVNVLWRNGYVPQWVDLSVVGETGDSTIIEVAAAGHSTWMRPTTNLRVSPARLWRPVSIWATRTLRDQR
jgi:hypothetical protein